MNNEAADSFRGTKRFACRREFPVLNSKALAEASSQREMVHAVRLDAIVEEGRVLRMRMPKLTSLVSEFFTKLERQALARVALTIKHYYWFDECADRLKDGQLFSSESWDVVRLEHPNFSIPNNREDWLASLETGKKDGQDPRLAARAQRIINEITSRGITNVHSVGVGNAPLEYHMKLADSSIWLTASDYSKVSIDRLQRVFLECDAILQFNILDGDWKFIQPVPEKSVVLMYRVDPSFSNEEWRSILATMSKNGCRNILFVPARLLTFQYAQEIGKRHWGSILGGRGVSFTGYIRSQKAIHTLWSDHYVHEELDLEGLTGFWLSKPPVS